MNVKSKEISEKYLLENGYEKKQTPSHTDIFWKSIGHFGIYIHANNWNLGLYSCGDNINIRDFKTVKELKAFEKLLSISS